MFNFSLRLLLISMKFFKNPFLFFTIAYILGIHVRLETNLFATILFICSATVVLLTIFRKRISKIPAIFLLLFLIGFLRVDKQSVELPSNSTVTSIIEIVERKNTSKDWDQSIGIIHSVRDQGVYKSTNQKILLYTNSDVLREGMQVLAILSPRKIQNTYNPGSFNAETYWMSKGISHLGFITDEDFSLLDFQQVGFLKRFTDATRTYIINVLDEFSDDHTGILKALLLGEKGDLSTEIKDQFANAGAMHLLAVSGLHIGIIAFLLLFLFEQFPRVLSSLTAHILVVIILWIYAILTGLSPSVTRAVLMFSLLILSRLATGQYDPVNILFFSAFIVVSIDPLVIYDIGFQLSYLAVLGIFIFQHRFVALIPFRSKALNWFWQGTCIGISAQLATAPLSLYYFHQFPNYFVLSNLGIMLISAILMFTSIIYVVTYQLNFLKVVLLFVLSILISILIQFIAWIDGLPWSVARGFELHFVQILIYFLAILFLLNYKKSKWSRLVGIVAVFTFIVSIQISRYINLTSEHLIIVNNDKPMAFLRVNQKTLCLTAEPELRKKDQMIIKDYVKIYPSELEYLLLEPNSSFMVDEEIGQFRIERNNDGIHFFMNETRIRLLTHEKNFNDATISSYTVGMPYIKNRVDFQLMNGAFIMRI